MACSFLALGPGAMAQVVDTDSWVIHADSIRPQDYYGETVANGMIGIVSSPEPFSVRDVVLNGAYDLYGRGRVSNILKTFQFVNMHLDIDGERIESFDQVRRFGQDLDLRHAGLTTHFDVGDRASVTYTMYALRHLPYCALVDVTIRAEKDITISPASVMEAPDMLRDVQSYYNQVDGPRAKISLLTSTARSPTGKLLLAASTAFLFDGPAGGWPVLYHEIWDNGMHLMKFTRALKAGETYHFALVGTSLTSAHDPDPLNQAERLTLFAALQGRDRLVAFHDKAWDALWKSDIVIDGDPVTQREVRSMIYHLYSFAREGTAYSLSPMGLSGLGYNGHIFWDADLWMFPALLMLQPGIARSMVEYRIARLPEAKQNAFAHGYKGAMFPWESAESGDEETPVWALSGPFEHHITADVGLEAWQYFCVTRDTAWLRGKGYPLLSETADFWASRVERNGPGRYDIDNVVAADEWAENVDNNAFTNAAARADLRAAGAAARVLGQNPDPDWAHIADNIPIPHFEDGTTREYDGYAGQPIKQADVNLLAYPLHEVTDTQAIRRDLDYYEPKVGEGPAMTQAIFAILYERLGDPERAYKTFKEGYVPNLRPPFGVIAETATGNNPYFCTGAGGLLQAMLSGFGGMEITPQGLRELPVRLPARWKSLTLTNIGPNKITRKIWHTSH